MKDDPEEESKEQEEGVCVTVFVIDRLTSQE